MRLVEAKPQDAEAILSLRRAAAADLTERFGRGHWSTVGTERGVLHTLRQGRMFLARGDGALLGVLALSSRKPWAIDPSYFTPVRRPLHLTDMTVAPRHQRQGVGRWLLEQAAAVAYGWPADAIRLDAYDGAAGAGPFYAACGYAEVGRVTYRSVPLVYFERVIEGPAAGKERSRRPG